MLLGSCNQRNTHIREIIYDNFNAYHCLGENWMEYISMSKVYYFCTKHCAELGTSRFSFYFLLLTIGVNLGQLPNSADFSSINALYK